MSAAADAPRLRPYRPADRSACLALLDGCSPEYFAPRDRADFEQFLANPLGAFLVLELPAGPELAGCGGYYVDPARGSAGLSWGIIARPLHGRGLGRALLLERLARLCAEHPAELGVRIQTSQHTEPFFGRFGFAATRRVPGGYGPGLDTVEMELRLDDAARARLAREHAGRRAARGAGAAPRAGGPSEGPDQSR